MRLDVPHVTQEFRDFEEVLSTPSVLGRRDVVVRRGSHLGLRGKREKGVPNTRGSFDTFIHMVDSRP